MIRCMNNRLGKMGASALYKLRTICKIKEIYRADGCFELVIPLNILLLYNGLYVEGLVE